MNTRSGFLRSAWCVLLALVFSLSLIGIPTGQVSGGGALAVTSTGDGNDANPGDGFCDTGAGLCTLRAAVQESNAFAGAQTVLISVSGTITLGSNLPIITGDLTIDGSGYNVTISGDDHYQVLYVNTGVSVYLDHLNIINGARGSGNAGGIDNYGTLTITNSAFSNNYARDFGGGILNGSLAILTITNSTFSGNSANHGGGIYNSDGKVTLTNCTFNNNTASIDGGGIESSSGLLTVTNSTFYNNSAARYGGGIENEISTLTVTNSTFSHNSASSSGGGIDVNSGTFHLKNTILANSTNGGDCTSIPAPVTAINNLIEINSGCGTPVFSADPHLGPLMNNGGPTQTMALQAGSPAVDAGDDATCAAAPVNNLDQRGVTRPYGTHCDIGSYEQKKSSLTTRSTGTYDGHILESGESTTVGGTMDSTSTTFNLGDGAGDKQYRAVLSFNTAALPDDAVISNVMLKILKQTQVGTNPFNILGGLKVDIRKPYFGGGPGLVISDFQAAADRSAVGTFGATPVVFWYRTVIGAVGFPYINKTGITQFRLRFATDDNNDNEADYVKFYSGNYADAASRPALVIEYYVP